MSHTYAYVGFDMVGLNAIQPSRDKHLSLVYDSAQGTWIGMRVVSRTQPTYVGTSARYLAGLPATPAEMCM